MSTGPPRIELDGGDIVRWGVLGTGMIAQAFARFIGDSPSARLVAVGSRSAERARSFVTQHAAGAARAHGSYSEVIADSDVDAVYVATPHPLHCEQTVDALRAGKHVLCEKPLAMNRAEAVAMMEVARETGRFLTEAFMFRFHPQTDRLLQLIGDGAIGDVRLIRVARCHQIGDDRTGRLVEQDLGGGAILDLGCYAASLVRLVAGVAGGAPFADPSELKATAFLNERWHTDDISAASLRFDSGIVASLTLSARCNLPSPLEIGGSSGFISVPEPTHPAKISHIVLARDASEPERIECRSEQHVFTGEIEAVSRAIIRGDVEEPRMTLADSVGNMATLDAWGECIGLRYER